MTLCITPPTYGVDPLVQYARRLSHMHDTLTQRLCYAFGVTFGLTIGILAFSFGANSPSSLPVAPSPIHTYTY